MLLGRVLHTRWFWFCSRFNGHPPLGVNATNWRWEIERAVALWFQRAPTLGGECYPFQLLLLQLFHEQIVSTGTHPWG